MTTLSFGGAGFIGRRVTDRLAGDGEEVICVDVCADDAVERDGVTVTDGDVTDVDAVCEIVERYAPERVLNLAYVLGAESDVDPSLAVRVNCVGMDNVFRAAVESGVERVVYASSMTVYGTAGGYDTTVTEDVAAPAAYTQYPWLFYGATKQLNEYQSRHYADEHGLDAAAIRPSIVFGPGRDSGLTKWASEFVSKPARGDVGHLPFDAEQELNMVYREDVADLVVRMLRADSLAHHAYNTGGHTVTAGRLARLVEDTVGGRVTLDEGTEGKLVPDVSHERSHAELGYELTPLEECLRDHAERSRD
jgi:nucleoside-diphosphate-sugar epimerase